MQNVRHITQNADHTTQKDGRTMRNVCHNTLNVCQGPKGGGLEMPPTHVLEKLHVHSRQKSHNWTVFLATRSCPKSL